MRVGWKRRRDEGWRGGGQKEESCPRVKLGCHVVWELTRNYQRWIVVLSPARIDICYNEDMILSRRPNILTLYPEETIH